MNLIFFGLGVFLIYNTYLQLGDDIVSLNSALKSPIYFTLVFAIIVTFISFLGCYGTCYENACMIKSYAFFILVCIILQVTVVVLIYKLDVEEVRAAIKGNTLAKFTEQETSIQRSIQVIQEQYHCCGFDSSKDFNGKIPDSCCGKYNDTIPVKEQVNNCAQSEIYKTSCKDSIMDRIGKDFKYIYIVVGCIFAFEILVVILSCVLSKNIREQYNVV